MLITIDGPAGTGKSTTARKLAERLCFAFFDTGAMYRSFTWYVIQKKIDPNDDEKIQELLDSFSFDTKIDKDNTKHYFVNQAEITEDIRSPEVSQLVSEISAKQKVRDSLVSNQRKFALHKNAVFEGRDMGTVVFPRADIKIFLTAKEEVRAERRCKELQEKFPEKQFTTQRILEEIRARDTYDSSRKISPLCSAEDAFIIDTTELTPHQLVEKILKIQKTKFSKKKRITKLPRFFHMPFCYSLVIFLVLSFLKIFYRLKVFGVENFISGPAIIAANHASFLDPPVVAVSCPEEIHFLAKESLFEHRFFGSLIRKLNSHPLTGKPGDIKVFRLIGQLLKEGKKVLLFPEGNRTETGHLGEILPGIAFLVQMNHVPIIPVYVYGTFSAWKRGRPLPKPFGKIRCVFGSPIHVEEFSYLSKKEMYAAVSKQMKESFFHMEQWCKNGFLGTPP
jgi:cytidylate kinase